MKQRTNILNFSIGDESLVMIPIEGGTYKMGATSEQGNKVESDERPAHQVAVGDYWIGETPVTDALWDAVMQDTKFPSESPLPKVNIKYSEAQKFLDKLNGMRLPGTEGKVFRLPTEAEWEYAARGGRQNRHCRYSGSNNIDDVAWYWDNSVPAPQAGSHFYIGEPEIQAVKKKRPNELGLYDMSGNVLEWCSDWYGDYIPDNQVKPKGPRSGKERVCRGGYYEVYPEDCRVASRYHMSPKTSCEYLGFRVTLAEKD